MADGYRIFGAEMSPYSVKVRSYFRYKGFRTMDFAQCGEPGGIREIRKMPIIPLVMTPDGTGIQDSTPIIDRIEKFIPSPRSIPATQRRISFRR